MKSRFERDDPEMPQQVGRLIRRLALVLVVVLVALALVVRRAIAAQGSAGLVLAGLLLAFLALCLLQAVRMLAAWKREVIAEREAREERSPVSR